MLLSGPGQVRGQHGPYLDQVTCRGGGSVKEFLLHVTCWLGFEQCVRAGRQRKVSVG